VNTCWSSRSLERRQTPPHGRRRAGFTLVELLVVIGVLATVMALLLPTIRGVREQARRTVCASRLRSLAAAAVNYAVENHGMLPSGQRDAPDGSELCIYVSQATYGVLARYVGGRTYNPPPPRQDATGDPQLACPNLADSASLGLPYFEGDRNIGWMLGYNYLGNHKIVDRNNLWPVASPIRLTDKGSLPLFSDLNDWSPRDNWTVVPHQRSGGGGYFFGEQGGSTPVAFGAAGGNVAFLDGSVRWKQVGRPAVGNGPTGPFNKFGEMLWYYTYSHPNATTADHSYVGLW
jgi:prepilin-type N-terminal cleavage/methylation domain-containing protein/prepilin-type processing-associated H-X9-DG protein